MLKFLFHAIVGLFLVITVKDMRIDSIACKFTQFGIYALPATRVVCSRLNNSDTAEKYYFLMNGRFNFKKKLNKPGARNTETQRCNVKIKRSRMWLRIYVGRNSGYVRSCVTQLKTCCLFQTFLSNLAYKDRHRREVLPL